MPYIGKGLESNTNRKRFIYTATSGQTSFSGTDDASLTLGYDDTLYMDVYQNGVLLVPATDYAATTGTSVVLGQGASTDDTVEMVVYDVVAVGDTISASAGGAFGSDISASTVNATSDTAAGANAAMGFTAAEGLILTGQGSTNDVTIKNDADADVIEIPTGTVNVTIAGNLTLGDGNLVVATGHGIDYSAQSSTNGSAAELLDHYEEGTWTPTVASDAGAAAYTTQVGFYTRIGSICHVSATVQVSNMGSFSGAVINLSGFPFIVSDVANYNPIGSLVLDGTANAKENIFLRFTLNTILARLEQANGQTTHDNNMNANAFDTGTILKMSGSYIVK